MSMNTPAEHKKVFFVPGEVVFHIQHLTTDTPVATRQLILGALNTILPSDKGKGKKDSEYSDWLGRLSAPAENVPIITFQTSSQVASSLIPIPLAGNENSENGVLDVLRDAYSNLQGNSMNITENVDLLTLCPNWISRNLHHGAATGGPGSWPTEIDGASGFRFAGKSLTSLQIHRDKLGNGKVYVAILDTLLPGNIPDELAFIQTRPYPYQGSDPRAIGHLRSHTPRSDHYRMSNHGTFIASIVNAIAPSAPVYLYEVLNDFAVGSYISVAWGLATARNEWAVDGNSLIINCSFMLSLPDGNIGELFLRDLARAFEGNIEKTIATLGSSMRAIFEAVIQTPNVVMVAAAGNDAAAEVRPPARYPAAFKGVIGVGALPKGNPQYPSGRYKPASYSNFSYSRSENKFPNEGFVVFGGELDEPIDNMRPPSKSPYAKDGVLGRYVGNFPKRNAANGNIDEVPPVNPNSEAASWAGTSFAAPVITGILAAQVGGDQLTIDDSLAPANGPYLTVEDENVIVAQQG